MFRFMGLASILFLSGCGKASWDIVPEAAASEPAAVLLSGEASGRTLVVVGKTMPAPGRISEIAAAVMHPVERVLVMPGDIVKAGQPLVEIDCDEPEAEVSAKQEVVHELTAALAKLKAMPRAEERAEAAAQLEGAQIATLAARAYLDRLASLRTTDSVSAREHIEQETVLKRAEADERAAQAHLDYLRKLPVEHEIAEIEHQLAAARAELVVAECELEHYTIHAAIDGVVCWLDVTPGTVNRAGTKVWGEIVDIRELDVRVELSTKQLSEIDRSQPVVVEQPELEKTWAARVVYVAPAANRDTGLIPVVLRIDRAGDPLRCHLNVSVRFNLVDANRRVNAPSQDALAVEVLDE